MVEVAAGVVVVAGGRVMAVARAKEGVEAGVARNRAAAKEESGKAEASAAVDHSGMETRAEATVEPAPLCFGLESRQSQGGRQH